MVLNPEGRAVWNSSTSKWEYEYDVKDHLGNIRASFAPTTDKVKVLQTRDYYPFGMEMASWYVNDANATKFRYNGKELQDEGGLGWYDYGARFYDPELGRFLSIDPHAESYDSWTPYNYVANNPILIIDPNGMDWYTSQDGSATMWRKGSEDIEGYKNLGAEYTMQLGDGAAITYTQNEATEFSVTTDTEWISQYSKSEWSGTPSDKACGKASDAMLGGKVDTGSTTITKTAGNGRAGEANSDAPNAINSMKNAIDNGSGIKVGVDFRDGSSGHRDGMGDHFVVVNGYSESLSNGKPTSTSFNYLDPGTRHKSKGAASTNSFNIKSGRLVGTHINNGLKIIVTSIRKK